jgi:hypothetical protein
MRVQRTRSSPSALRSPLTRHPLGRGGSLIRAWASVALAGLAIGVAVGARADEGPDWFSATKVSLRASYGNDFANVVMSMATGHDFRIDTSQRKGDKSYSGSLIVVAGKRLLTKGIPLEPGTEIDVLDGPVLYVRLVFELLCRGLPAGPASVKSVRKVNVAEDREPLVINTPSGTNGEFPAPWTLSGSVRPDGAGIAFDLLLACNGLEPFRLKGSWTRAAALLELPDSMSLAGWRVFSLGVYSIPADGGTVTDYGAQEFGKPFLNLGAVRREVADSNQ